MSHPLAGFTREQVEQAQAFHRRLELIKDPRIQGAIIPVLNSIYSTLNLKPAHVAKGATHEG